MIHAVQRRLHTLYQFRSGDLLSPNRAKQSLQSKLWLRLINLQDFGFRKQISDLKKQISDFKKQISDFKKQISDFKKKDSDFKKKNSDLKKQNSDFKKQISDFKKLISVFIGNRFQKTDFGFQKTDFGFRKTDFGFRKKDFGFKKKKNTLVLTGFRTSKTFDVHEKQSDNRDHLLTKCYLYTMFDVHATLRL